MRRSKVDEDTSWPYGNWPRKCSVGLLTGGAGYSSWKKMENGPMKRSDWKG